MAGLGGVLLRGLAFLAIGTVFVAGLRWAKQTTTSYFVYQPPLSGLVLLDNFQFAPVQARNNRVVYPYSVVPGGVTSTEELRQVAAHDSAVAQHYAGFDYKHARVVQVDQPRLVYLSYRVGDHIYWTRKQASLRVGETLLTDGHLTARTRCGNQVSVLPQAKTSPQEPAMAEMDRPDALASGIRAFPLIFDSDLLEADPALPIRPLGQKAPGVGFPPIAFIPIPIGGETSGGGAAAPTPACSGNSCNSPLPPAVPPPPAPIPEPATIVLIASGTAAVIMRMRQRKS